MLLAAFYFRTLKGFSRLWRCASEEDVDPRKGHSWLVNSGKLLPVLCRNVRPKTTTSPARSTWEWDWVPLNSFLPKAKRSVVTVTHCLLLCWIKNKNYEVKVSAWKIQWNPDFVPFANFVLKFLFLLKLFYCRKHLSFCGTLCN